MSSITRPAPPVSPDADPVEAHLAEVAWLCDDHDRTMGRIARLLVSVRDDGRLPERLGGMSLQVWLEHTCRIRSVDARQLLGCVDVLARMPRLLEGLCDRWVSWTQTQAICKAARQVPIGQLDQLDRLVADQMISHADWEPDALVADVWDWVDTRQPTRLEREEKAAERGDFLALSPRLFGGGAIYGEYGPVGFATLAETLDAPLGPPAAVPDLDDPNAVADAFDTLDEQRRMLARDHGAAMAQRLLDVCERELGGAHGPDGDTDGSDRKARPLLLATVEADALLDRTRTPGWLLHTLSGGRMKVSASLLQQLVDERGADLETIVLDDCGQIVGVGRRSYVPPGWLRRAMWAAELTVADPDRTTPIRRADLDHQQEWPDGTTDVTNLAPLGRRWHNQKTTKRWKLARARNGTTTWTHRRHGWKLTLAPPRRDLADPPDVGPPRLPLDLTNLDPPPHRLAHTA